MNDLLVPLGGDAPALSITIPPDPQDANQLSGFEISAINEHRGTWMTAYTGAADLRVVDLILPGTHDSGMDKEAPYTNSYETTQDKSPWYQLMSGIRVLDLRVQYFSGYAVNDPRRFQIFHSLSSGRTVRGDVLQAVTNWRNGTFSAGDPKREIVILDFHQFKNFTADAHHELMKLIKDYFGDLIIRPDQRNLYVRELWRGTGRVVVTYHDVIRDNAFFWDLDQKYSGSGSISTDNLKRFMDGVATRHKPDGGLESIQCHKLAGLGVPDDFQGKIGEWFYSNDAIGGNAYIQKFHIINTDWATRGRYIDYCIHATWIKSKIYSQHVNIFVDYDGDFEIPPLKTPSVGVYTQALVPNVYLPSYQGATGNGFLLLVRNMSGKDSILHMSGSDYGAPTIKLTENKTVELKYDIIFKGWRCISPPPILKIDSFKILSSDGYYPIELIWDTHSAFQRYRIEVLHDGVRARIAEDVQPPYIIEGHYQGEFNVVGEYSATDIYSNSVTFKPVPTEIKNFRVVSPYPSFPLEFQWDSLPSVSEYTVFNIKSEGVETYVVHQPQLVVDSLGGGVWFVEADWEGKRLKSVEVMARIDNFEINSENGFYPIRLSWDEVLSRVTDYVVVVRGYFDSYEVSVSEPSLVISTGERAVFSVKTQAGSARTTLTSPAREFSPEGVTEVSNFRIVSPGTSSPLIFEWDPVPRSSSYRVIALINEIPQTLLVEEPRLVVENYTNGLWHVEAWWGATLIRSKKILTYSGTD